MARRAPILNLADERGARDELLRRVSDLHDVESRLARLEARVDRARVAGRELQVDIDELRAALLSTRSGTIQVDQALHELGVRVYKLQAAIEHPGRRLALMRSMAGLPATAGPSSIGTGPRIVTSARWQLARSESGAMIGMQALAVGFPEGTTAEFRIAVRGTDRVVGRVTAKVNGDMAAALWRTRAPEQYVFQCAVEDCSSNSGVLEVIPQRATG